jgi:replicative superfamily II helicase
MAIEDDLTILDHQLKELITRYEQYFVGLEKREPLQLLAEVQKMVRRYATVFINNTMYKHKYNMLVARFNTYREHWNRILRQIEEGKYSRDRFIRDLHLRQKDQKPVHHDEGHEEHHKPPHDPELDRIFHELREARKTCHLSVDKLSIELVAATIEKSKAALAARLGTSDLVFRVVVEDGKPKIKASQRK